MTVFVVLGSVLDSAVDVLLDRLRGLCDCSDTPPEVFHDHEVVFILKDFNAPPTQVPQSQGVMLRIRRALNKPSLPWQLRYTGQPEIGSRPAILRNCLDIPVSQNVCEFLQELGAKVDHEFITKGSIMRKGRIKVTVFKMFKVSNEQNLEPLTMSYLVEVSVLTTRTDEAVADELRAFADQLKPLAQLEKLDYRRPTM
ncbi:UNVERIFIED_CONTAM: hypothetical protein GTU68_038839 [Idotea baltica]|nr:hypothetical protein [Idotea baltica]